MIKVYTAESRFSAENDWLRSSFHFSFGPYHDPSNTRFGPMRVLNDDYLAPQKGFGAHPHSDMEVVSIVLTGTLRHQDNLGNIGVTSWGEIQRMTAGSGIIHTEFSASEDEELNSLQMWFEPEQKGLEPSYEITSFPVDSLTGNLVPVASSNASAHVAKVHQDMTIYLNRLHKGEHMTFKSNQVRRLFLMVLEGAITLNGDVKLNRRDSARITEISELLWTATEDALVMLIDLP